jgi:hypothetical protein
MHQMPPNHALVRLGGYRYNFYLDTRTGSVLNRRLFSEAVARSQRGPVLA